MARLRRPCWPGVLLDRERAGPDDSPRAELTPPERRAPSRARRPPEPHPTHYAPHSWSFTELGMRQLLQDQNRGQGPQPAPSSSSTKAISNAVSRHASYRPVLPPWPATISVFSRIGRSVRSEVTVSRSRDTHLAGST